MSHEFIQAGFHKKTGRETNDNTYEFEATESKLSKPQGGVVLLVPKAVSSVHYNKLLVECCVNMLFECAQSLSKNIDLRSMSPDEFAEAVTGEGREEYVPKRKTEHGIDIEMTHQVREIAGLLQWISNSTSWGDGEYHSFDKAEITRRLEMLKFFSR